MGERDPDGVRTGLRAAPDVPVTTSDDQAEQMRQAFARDSATGEMMPRAFGPPRKDPG